MTRYAVELQPGCWLAPWSGDPGRTCVIDTAATWANKVTATRKLKEARFMRTFPEARVIQVRVSLVEVAQRPHPAAGSHVLERTSSAPLVTPTDHKRVMVDVARIARAEGRREGIEEAARVCEEHARPFTGALAVLAPSECAAIRDALGFASQAIRGLLTKETT